MNNMRPDPEANPVQLDQSLQVSERAGLPRYVDVYPRNMGKLIGIARNVLARDGQIKLFG